MVATDFTPGKSFDAGYDPANELNLLLRLGVSLFGRFYLDGGEVVRRKSQLDVEQAVKAPSDQARPGQQHDRDRQFKYNQVRTEAAPDCPGGANETINAIAVLSGFTNSPEVTAAYNIDPP